MAGGAGNTDESDATAAKGHGRNGAAEVLDRVERAVLGELPDDASEWATFYLLSLALMAAGEALNERGLDPARN